MPGQGRAGAAANFKKRFSMSGEPTIKVVVDKKQLLQDLQNLDGLMAEYHQLLGRVGDDGSWEDDAISLIKSHQQYLANANVSLKVIDMVSAIMRGLLDKLQINELTLKVNPEAGVARGGAQPVSLDDSGAPGVEIFEQLIGRVNSVAQNAPLALQERIRYLLLSSLNLFKGLVSGSQEGIDDAVNQINLLTSSRESQNLVKEIAIIARDIYNTLNHLSDEIPVLDTLTESTDGISEAARKLKAVVQKLEDAAFANLDYLETLTSRLKVDEDMCERVQESLRKSQHMLGELKLAHPDKAEELTVLQDRLSDQIGSGIILMRSKIQENSDTFLSLTATQGFQDLTGQTLKKTIVFIEDLQMQLVELLQKFRPMLEATTGAGQEPATSDEEEAPSGKVVSQSQDEVDQLLADLGF